MKKVYEPFKGEFKDGVLKIKNRKRFSSLGDLYAEWEVSSDGRVLNQGTLDSLDIAPEDENIYDLFNENDYKDYENCFLTVSFKQKENTAWAKKGYEVGFLQFELGVFGANNSVSQKGNIICDESDRIIKLSANGSETVFDKKYGKLISFKKNGKDIISESASFDIWRAPTYNGGSKKQWYLEGFDRINQNTYDCIIKKDSEKIVIDTNISLGANSAPPVIKMNVKWSFDNAGELTVECKGNVREKSALLPHLGLKFIMPKEFENAEYFGYGDKETYPDRHKAFKLGLYKTTVTDMYEHYICPQECGNRFATRYASIAADDGSGIKISALNGKDFCFKALHYDTEDIINAEHDFDLPPADKTVLNIDWKVNAISEAEDLDVPKNSRNLGDKEFDFGFKIVPFNK